ncbi:MAG: glycerol-3-phosphate dehydrogenase (NAD(P)+), partial [Oleiphilaceae bacterium]
MSDSKRIAVLGGGSFGTAIANIAAEYGVTTYLWMRNEQAVEEIRVGRKNQKYLPDLILHKNLIPTTDLHKALEGASLVFFAVPSKSFRE